MGLAFSCDRGRLPQHCLYTVTYGRKLAVPVWTVILVSILAARAPQLGHVREVLVDGVLDPDQVGEVVVSRGIRRIVLPAFPSQLLCRR